MADAGFDGREVWGDEDAAGWGMPLGAEALDGRGGSAFLLPPPGCKASY